MEKVAIFPGSFDPFSVGHEALVHRGLRIFDKIIVAVGHNISKGGCFSLEARMAMIKKTFENDPRVEVDSYEGLTVDYCKRREVPFIIRGLRTSADFEFERAVGQTNHLLNTDIESVFLLTAPEHSFISSSVIRDILTHGGNVSHFVPANINIFDYVGR